jgi:hypothetical protein
LARESRLALDCKGSRLLSLHGQNLQPAPTDLAECEVLAEQVQAQWNLGLDPIPNLTQLLEQHGIQLLLLPLPAGVYGLTNTYFEGEAARHPKARRGHSKGKRTDKTVFVLLSRQVPYQDSTVDDEALAVQRHAPRWIKQLRKFGYLPKMA